MEESDLVRLDHETTWGGVNEQGGSADRDPCRQKHVADDGAGGVLIFTPKIHLAGISHTIGYVNGGKP